MPFGSFMAQRRDPRSQKERPTREKQQKEKKPVVQTPPKEEKMVFHDLNSDSLKINVLLFGRSISTMQEFLCSMSENMSKELHQEGVTYYTTELGAITDITDKKKKLERFFWEFSKKDWCCSENQEDGRVYTFSISPAGSQEKTLDMVFHCRVYNAGGSISFEQADAVWYLADGVVMDTTVGYDAYRAFLKESIGGVSAPAEGMKKPVCLLLSQIEKYGHFGGIGAECILKQPVRRKLINHCRELFACGENVEVAVIPVQIYGGLEYAGTDENCNPVLRLSESGYYQSYIPENCQVPGLYTIGRIAQIKETDFFAGDSCGGMKKVIHRHFARKKGELDWKPDMLREVTEA